MARRLTWFLPENPDVLRMLRKQGEITERGMDALAAWASGEEEAAQRVRDAEHEADTQKRALRVALKSAFITPIGAEDIFVMSGRLDAVLNGAKDAVRESEIMAMAPDEAVVAMCGFLAEGVHLLAQAFAHIAGDADGADAAEATDAADAAVKAQRQVERVYRRAMSALLEVEDLRAVMGRRELYRRFSRISEDITEVAERVWYAAVKEA